MPERLQRIIEGMPLAWAMPLTFVAFAVLVVVIWSIPRDVVMAGAPSQSRWRDLRLWATALIITQLGIYLLVS